MARATWLFLAASCLAVVVAVGASDCEVCDLREEVADLKEELEDCKKHLEGAGGSYLSKVCGWVTSDPAKEARNVMKRTVRDVLATAGVADHQVRRHQALLQVSLSADDLAALRRFLLNDEGGADDARKILVRSIAPATTTAAPSSSRFAFSLDLLEHEGFVVGQIVAACLFVGVALWRKVKVWRVCVAVVTASLAWTWVHLYKVALSKKQAALRRLGDVPQGCLVEKQGWTAAVSDAFSTALGLSSSTDARCEAYYEALMVDPFWEVTPLHAVTDAASRLVLGPLEMAGASVGTFLSEVIAPMPLLWKLPAMAAAAVLLLTLLLMACRYRIKSPLLFSIEPSSSSSSKKKKLKQDGGGGDVPATPPPPPLQQLPYPTAPNQIDHIENFNAGKATADDDAGAGGGWVR